jgi:methionine-rich copper-binding protein CopC
MTFLEALEANKTLKVYCKRNLSSFEVGEMHDETKHESFSLAVIEAQWAVGPYDVSWQIVDANGVKWAVPVTFGALDLKIFDGKQTRISIEAIK